MRNGYRIGLVVLDRCARLISAWLAPHPMGKDPDDDEEVFAAYVYDVLEACEDYLGESKTNIAELHRGRK